MPQDERDEKQWHIENWGTKWDLRPGDVDYASFDEEDGKAGEDLYSFVTAWTPPTSFLAHVGPMFPALTFHMYYSEPMMMFAGEYLVKGKDITDTEFDEDRAAIVIEQLYGKLAEYEVEEEDDEDDGS